MYLSFPIQPKPYGMKSIYFFQVKPSGLAMLIKNNYLVKVKLLLG